MLFYVSCRSLLLYNPRPPSLPPSASQQKRLRLGALAQYASIHHTHYFFAQLGYTCLAEGLNVLSPKGVSGEEGEGKGLGQQVVVHVHVLDADGADGQGWEEGGKGGKEGRRSGGL